MASDSSLNNKAFLLTEDNQTIPCLFNPGELALNQSNGWAADVMPGKGVPTLRYTGATSGRLRLNLFFDTTDTGSPVTDYTKKIVGLMEVNDSLPGSSAVTNNARPPWVVFNWGDFHSFKAVVSDLELTFEYFSSTGTPLRARAVITLKQYQEDMAFGPQNPTSGTPEAPPRPPGAAGRNARSHRGHAPRRSNLLAHHRRRQRDRGPPGPAPRQPAGHPRAHLMPSSSPSPPRSRSTAQALGATWLSALIEVRVEREFQVPGRCTLRFGDPGYALIEQGLIALGTPLVVEALAEDGSTSSLINGEVTSIAIDQREGEQPELVIVAHDKSHRLGRGTSIKSYLTMAYSDIVTQLASDCGLTATVDSTDVSYDYVMKVDSDLGLLSELADRVGYDWWVEDQTLYFQKPAAGTTVSLALGDPLRSFSVRASGQPTGSVTVNGWNRAEQQSITSNATTASAGAGQLRHGRFGDRWLLRPVRHALRRSGGVGSGRSRPAQPGHRQPGPGRHGDRPGGDDGQRRHHARGHGRGDRGGTTQRHVPSHQGRARLPTLGLSHPVRLGRPAVRRPSSTPSPAVAPTARATPTAVWSSARSPTSTIPTTAGG